MKAKTLVSIVGLSMALLFAVADVAAQQGVISLDKVTNLIGPNQIKAAENMRFILRFNNNTGRKVDISNGFRVWSPDGAVWDSTTFDTIGEVVAGESRFGLYFNVAFSLIEDNCDGVGMDTVGILGAGIPTQAARQLPIGYNDTALAITAWSDDLRSVGKTICIDTCFFQPGGTWKWVRIEGGTEYNFYPAFQGLAGRTYSTDGYCFQIVQGTPEGAGEVSIARVSDLVGDSAVEAGKPIRFLLNYHNNVGEVIAGFQNGFRITSPDGASWDSTTIDTVGYAATGHSPFAAYFDLLKSLQARNRDGVSPDTVFAAGVALNQGLPIGYNDSAIAVTAWFHDKSAVGKHICLDSTFIPPAGRWAWVGEGGMPEYYPSFLGLAGQPYTPGSGFCFEIVDVPIQQCRVLNVPGQFANIQDAINAANDCDTILVQPGTYSVVQLMIEKQIVLRSANGPVQTTLTGAPSIHLIVFNGASANGAVLEGFTVDGGYIGIWCQNAAPIIRRNIVKNQTITNWAAVVLSGPGYGMSGVSPAVIENNTIIHAANGGISTFSTISPTIRNNIIAFNGQYGIHNQDYSQPIMSYNDIFGNPGYATANVDDLGPGALAVDPLLAGDFSLTAGSPCIDAGDPNPTYNDPDGSRNDMGAVPSAGGTPPDFINIVQWKKTEGGNDHWYGVIPRSLYWVEANVEAADSLPGASGLGYLATITSHDENMFILEHVVAGTNQTSILDEFWLGGRDIGGQWTWITGEPFVYTNWGTGEPNNVGIETALGMWGTHTTEPGKFNNSLPDSTVNQLHRFWSVVEWNAIDTLPPDVIPTNEWILVYCAVPKLDRGFLPPGSIITAYDPTGVLCGATKTNPDGSYGMMSIYRDDPYTTVDEGCQPGDLIGFKINGRPVYSQTPVHWSSNGDRFEVCQFLTAKCQEIQLHTGWNLISWNVALSTDIESLIAPFRDRVDLILGFDRGALSYDPDLVPFSTLHQVDHYHGYWFKMNSEATLRVCGGYIEQFNNIIPIYPGWNLVGYWPDAAWSVQNALMTVMSNLQVAIGYDMGAQLYIPGQGQYNTLTQLRPGFGYWIRSAARDGLEYFFLPTAGENRDQGYASAGGGNEMASRDWMSLYGKEITLDGRPISDNAPIEVFTDEGVKVGQSTYVGGWLKFMPVYGFDASDPNASRYPKDGDRVNVFVDGVRTEPSIEWHGAGATLQLSSLTTAVQVPDRYSLGQNFPNPFNPQTTISFDLPKAGTVKLTVFNMLGQKIRTLAEQRYDAGQHQVIWDGRSDNGDAIASGIYLYRLEADSFVASRKMILLK
jgi:hypothetical protein